MNIPHIVSVTYYRIQVAHLTTAENQGSTTMMKKKVFSGLLKAAKQNYEVAFAGNHPWYWVDRLFQVHVAAHLFKFGGTILD